MTRLQRALDNLADRGRPRGADTVFLAASERAARPATPLPRLRRSHRLMVAANVTLVVAAAGLITWFLLDDDAPLDVVTTPGVSPTSADTPPTGPAEETVAPLPDPELFTRPVWPDGQRPPDMPAVWIGHDLQNRLVVVDTMSGEVVRVLASFDDRDASTESPGEPLAGGSFLGSFTVAPDGRTVYFEGCCEPAAGMIYRVSVEGGEREEVTAGTFPAVSPDGSRLAVVELQSVKVIDLTTGETARFDQTEAPMDLRHLAWSPNGRSLAFERFQGDAADGSIVTFDVDASPSLSAEVVASASGEAVPMMASFDDRGRLHAVRQKRGRSGPEEPVQALVIDVTGPAVVSHRLLAAPVTSQDHDTSGRYLIRSFDNGLVRVRTSEGRPVELGVGYKAAAW